MSDNEPTPEADPEGTPPQRKQYSSLPHVPRVFGKYGFVICVVPYLIYMLGVQASGYFDSGRAHHAVQAQRSRVASIVDQSSEAVDQRAKTVEQRNAIQDLRLTELLQELREPEEMDENKIERLMQRFLAEDGPIPPAVRTAVREELDFLWELHEAESNQLYRDVLEKNYQRELEGHPESVAARTGKDWFPAGRTYYPTLYVFATIATTVLMLIVLPGYLKTPFNFSLLSIAVGVVGIVVWIGLWKIQHIFYPFDIRAAFNPYEELKDNPAWCNAFLAIRFWGYVAVVPIVEEFFLRGFLVRFCDDPDWDEIKLGVVGKWGWVGLLVYASFSHPGEAVASMAWFSMVTWLYIRTGSIWNCVIAHSVTNLLLALYVIITGTWILW